MNKSMLAGIGIGVAAALGVAAVASLNVFDRAFAICAGDIG